MAQKQPVGIAVAKFDYKTNDSHELNITKGEKLTLLDDSQHWWQVMNSSGETGYVPSNFCKKSKQSIFSSLRNTIGRKKSKDSSQSMMSCVTAESDPLSVIGRHSLTSSPKNIINSELVNNNNVKSTKNNNIIQQQQQKQQCDNSHRNDLYSAGNLLEEQSKPNKLDNQQQVDNKQLHNLHTQLPSHHLHKKLNGGNAITDAEQLQHVEPRPRMTINDSIDDGQLHSNNTSSLGPSCVAKFSYNACQPDELVLSRGDKIRVLEKSSDGWWKGELINNDSSSIASRKGWFPSNYVTLDRSQINNNNIFKLTGDSLERPIQSSSSVISMPSVITQPLSSNNNHNNNNSCWSSSLNKIQSLPRYSTVVTLFTFSKNQSEEMSFDANEILEVIERPAEDPDWWRCKNVNGEIGLVPRNYVKQLTSTEALIETQDQEQQISSVLPTQPNNIFDQKLFSPNSDSDNLRMGFNKTDKFKDKIWYWGMISRMECETLLITHGYFGQFVVRDSESHPGDLTITMHAGTQCRNFKIQFVNGEFQIGQKKFCSIEILIQHYRTHPIYKVDDDRLFLTDPFHYKTTDF